MLIWVFNSKLRCDYSLNRVWCVRKFNIKTQATVITSRTKKATLKFPHVKTICKAPSDLFTAHRSSGRLILLLISHPTVIFTCSELSSAVCSLAAGYGESFTDVHVYYSCHSLLLSVSHSLFPSLTLLDFLSQSLCLFLRLWQTCITCLSLIFHFPLPFAIRLLSLFVFFSFSYVPTLLPSDAPLSSSPPLSLYFVWLTSVITRLPLVFCFVYVVSLGLLSCTVRE